LIEDAVIPKNSGEAFVLKEGQYIRIGESAITDFAAFTGMSRYLPEGQEKADWPGCSPAVSMINF